MSFIMWWIVTIKKQYQIQFVRCDVAFIEPMHRNKPNITYLLTKFNLFHCL